MAGAQWLGDRMVQENPLIKNAGQRTPNFVTTRRRDTRIHRAPVINVRRRILVWTLASSVLCGSLATTRPATVAPGPLPPVRLVSAGQFNAAGTIGQLTDAPVVDFVDGRHGWAVGGNLCEDSVDRGWIYRSTDAAASWSRQYEECGGGPFNNSGFILDAVHFVDQQHGWVAGGFDQDGNDPLIMATTDGGNTWARQFLPIGTPVITGLDFVDRQHGWAVANQAILGTVDGGQTWTTQSQPALSDLRAVSFSDANHGWAVGQHTGGGNVALSTVDGGTTWTPLSVPYAGYLNGVKFVDALHGWVTGLQYGAQFTAAILATADGGNTWTTQYDGGSSSTSSYFSGVAATDSQHAWVSGAVGDIPLVLRTTDGGSSWQTPSYMQSDGATSAAATSVSFVDNQTGWIGVDGDRSRTMSTSDGGATWTYQPRPQGGFVSAAESGAAGNYCYACALQHAMSGALVADPVDPAYGDVAESVTDFAIPSRGYPLAFLRTYSSTRASINGPLGYGWSFAGTASLSVDGSTGNVTVHQENGAPALFVRSGSTFTPSAPRLVATLTANGDGTYTFTRHQREILTLSASGQLLSQADRNGNTTRYTYTGGRPTAITDSAGRSLTIGYTGSQITSVTDPIARSVRFAYDASGNLTAVTDVNGGTTHYAYDVNHLLLTTRDQAGNTVTNHFDASGRVDWQSDQLGRTTTLAYAGDSTSAAGGSTIITDPHGNAVQDVYEFGLLINQTRGYGTSQAATTGFAYDPASLGAAVVMDPLGHATLNSFDASGNLLNNTDALGNTSADTYDGLNDLTSSTDALGVTTTYSYDAAGNLVSRSTPLVGSGPAQSQVESLYRDDGAHPSDVTRVVDANGKTWQSAYNADGDVVSTTDPLGDVTAHSYNAVGWQLSSVSPNGNVSGCGCASLYTTTYGYADPSSGQVDEFGDVRSVIDPLGHRTTLAYDAKRNPTATTDADGNTTTYVYDAANELTATIRGDGSQLRTDYWPDGTVKHQIDGSGNTTSYGYDPLERETSVTDPLGRTTSFAYDVASNQLTKEDPGGSCAADSGCTHMAYDADHRLYSIEYSDGTTPSVWMQYDADGQRTGMSDGTGTSVWTWDSLHRLVSSLNGGGQLVGYGYTIGGWLTSLTYPSGHTVRRTFDSAGRMSAVTDWLGNTTTFAFDANSNLVTSHFPVALAGVQELDNYGFNAANQMTAASTTKTVGPLPAVSLFAASYAHDANGQVTADSSQPPVGTTYGYTQLNQLCSAALSPAGAGGCSPTLPAATTYRYDTADNLVQRGIVQQAFNASDQLCWTVLVSSSSNACNSAPTGATTFQYDSRGNRVAVTPPGPATMATALTYDQSNRLTTFQRASTTALYTYDGDGMRVAKTVNGHTDRAAWDVAGSLPLMIVDGSTEYVYGPGELPLEQISAAPTPTIGPVQIDVYQNPNNSASFPASGPDGTLAFSAGPYTNLTFNPPNNPPGSGDPGAPVDNSGICTSGGSKDWSSAHPMVFVDPMSCQSQTVHDATGVNQAGVAGAPFYGVVTSSVTVNQAGSVTFNLFADDGQLVGIGSDTAGHQPTAAAGSCTGSTWKQKLALIECAHNAAQSARQVDVTVSFPAPGTYPIEIDHAEDGAGAQSITVLANGAPMLPSQGILPSPSSVHFYHHDQLGSTRLLTDANGVVVAAYSYDPYGRPTLAVGAVGNPLRYGGQYRDSESSLYYLRARYYDPSTAQFLSRDPAVSKTMAPYGYAAGNPLSFTDPSGLYVTGCNSQGNSIDNGQAGPSNISCYKTTVYATVKDGPGIPLTSQWMTVSWTDTGGEASNVNASLLTEGHDGGFIFGHWDLTGESLQQSGGGAGGLTVTGHTEWYDGGFGLLSSPGFYANSLQTSICIGSHGSWSASGSAYSTSTFAWSFQTDFGAWPGGPGAGPQGQTP